MVRYHAPGVSRQCELQPPCRAIAEVLSGAFGRGAEGCDAEARRMSSRCGHLAEMPPTRHGTMPLAEAPSRPGGSVSSLCQARRCDDKFALIGAVDSAERLVYYVVA